MSIYRGNAKTIRANVQASYKISVISCKIWSTGKVLRMQLLYAYYYSSKLERLTDIQLNTTLSYDIIFRSYVTWVMIIVLFN